MLRMVAVRKIWSQERVLINTEVYSEQSVLVSGNICIYLLSEHNGPVKGFEAAHSGSDRHATSLRFVNL